MNKGYSFTGVLGCVTLVLIILTSVMAPLIAPYDPNAIDMGNTLQGCSIEHPLGTDLLGRDLLSRILYGGRGSMLLALFATLLSMLFGMIIGALSGYYGGIPDEIVIMLINIFQGLPGTSLMIAIAGIMGPSFQSLMLALVLTSWTGFARIVRTETLKLREENFVEGLRCIGKSRIGIVFEHILPNMIGNVVILFTTRIGRCILAISGLSFLGLGMQPPDPDWSVMLSDARMSFRSAPHVLIVPGVCIVLLVLSINFIGDMLRDILERRSSEIACNGQRD